MVPQIRRRNPATRVAVWTASTEARLIAEAAAAFGADAVFNRPADLEKLVGWISNPTPGGD
jgi:hypothetical protein